MPPEVLILTSFCQQVVVVRQQAVAVHQRIAAVVRQQAVVVARQQVVVVQWTVVLLQAVPQAFAGKIQQTELCLPIQVATTFSFQLPPNEFCF